MCRVQFLLTYLKKLMEHTIKIEVCHHVHIVTYLCLLYHIRLSHLQESLLLGLYSYWTPMIMYFQTASLPIRRAVHYVQKILDAGVPHC